MVLRFYIYLFLPLPPTKNQLFLFFLKFFLNLICVVCL